MKRIKLIWDFRGQDAHQTALHHEIHLNQFAQKDNLQNTKAGVLLVDDFYTIAYILVQEADMIVVRDALRPHRGEWSEQ